MHFSGPTQHLGGQWAPSKTLFAYDSGIFLQTEFDKWLTWLLEVPCLGSSLDTANGIDKFLPMAVKEAAAHPVHVDMNIILRACCW